MYNIIFIYWQGQRVCDAFVIKEAEQKGDESPEPPNNNNNNNPPSHEATGASQLLPSEQH
jgi:hypothetical protein